MSKIKTYWSFDPILSTMEKEELERAIHPEVTEWIRVTYPLLAERLEHNPNSKSAEEHEGASIPFSINGKQLWRCFLPEPYAY
jgi:hypothetical protein